MPPASLELVDVRPYLPRAVYEIRYATADNFTGKRLYPVARCFLARAVAERLRKVHDDLLKRGYRMKIYDGYRPHGVTKRMWALIGDERYVADPKKGSRHNRGAAIDLTLCDLRGRELPMPSAFDDFSERAHRDYTNASPEAIHHRRILEEAMAARGFSGLATEWWHFDARGWEHYPIRDVGLGMLARRTRISRLRPSPRRPVR
ncbi:peptidase M15 [bacterium]|nr:MAG: peptidase M15 [bacterium]